MAKALRLNARSLQECTPYLCSHNPCTLPSCFPSASAPQILSQARKLEEQAEWSYSMEASFIEIYNNQLRDLLGGGPGGAATYINDLHAIKHDPDGGHTVVAGEQLAPTTHRQTS